MKTIRCFVLMLVTAVILFSVSCAGGGNDEFFDVVYDGSYDGTKPQTFGGEHIVTNGFDSKNGAFGYLEETEFTDLSRKRIADVEKQLDVKIDVTEAPDFASLIMSGTFYADIMMSSSFGMIGPTRSGLFMNIADIVDVTDTEKYGNPTQLTSCYWKGGQYAVIPMYWPENIYNYVNYLLGVDENLVAKMGLTDPRDFSEQGTWTWDTFEKFLMDGTQNIGDKTIYGMGIHPPYFAEMFERTAGGNLYYMDEDGTVSIDWYRKNEAVSALLKAQELYNGDTSYCFYPSQDWGVLFEEFIADNMLMFTVPEGKMFGGEDTVMYRMDNAGIVQWPYEKTRDESLCSIHSSMGRVTYIPINTNDADAAGAVISALFEPLEGYETREKIIDSLNRSLFFDDRDTRLFLDMVDRCYYTFFIDGARALEEKTIGYSSPAEDVFQTLSSLKNTYDVLLERYVSPTFEGMKTVWSPEQIRGFFNMK